MGIYVNGQDVDSPFKRVGAVIYPKVSTDSLAIAQYLDSDSLLNILCASFPLNKLDRILEAHASDHGIVVVKGSFGIPLKIGSKWYILSADTNVSTATDLDTGVVSNGKDYYVYACDSGSSVVYKISLNSSYPAGYTASNSRKIGGFHTLCVSVGTITGHTLSGYVANDILPQSIWDLKHRCRNGINVGMVYSAAINKWVDIYLASGTGVSTTSVYGGTISDIRDWMDFVDDGAAIGKRLLNDDEFQAIAAGSNEETNITGSADPVTTGGHVDTATRRMISNIGCEDCAGAMWQWLLDQSFRIEGSHTHTENIAASYTQNAETAAKDIAVWAWYDLPGIKGSLYRQGSYGDVKLLAGGAWHYGARCGSRSRSAYYSRWNTIADIGGRFLAEPP